MDWIERKHLPSQFIKDTAFLPEIYFEEGREGKGHILVCQSSFSAFLFIRHIPEIDSRNILGYMQSQVVIRFNTND